MASQTKTDMVRIVTNMVKLSDPAVTMLMPANLIAAAVDAKEEIAAGRAQGAVVEVVQIVADPQRNLRNHSLYRELPIGVAATKFAR